MNNQPKITTVLGNTQNAVDVVFRKVFQHNNCPGTTLILDYMGRGAAILADSNKMSILKKNIHWFDLNDKRRTIQLFEISNSPNTKNILERLFRMLIQISNSIITPQTVVWLINTAFKYSLDGKLHLTTLLKLLANTEFRKLNINSEIDNEELTTMQKLLSWALRFPAVYAISEGINTIKLENCFGKKTVLWLESFYEHSERYEHYLLSGFIDIITENAIKNYFYNNPNSKLDFTILHIFPPQKFFLELPAWVKETSGQNSGYTKNIRHISIHNFLPAEPLKKGTIEWVNISENVWIVGKVGKLNKDKHKNWLSVHEMNLIDNLQQGKVWVKSNKTGRGIIANVKTNIEELRSLAYRFRTYSNQSLKITSISQLSTEVEFIDNKYNGVTGLYQKLCSIDFLQQGWFRVKEGKKESHGIDKITIKEFGENIERELKQLQYELKTKKYKCRPLRRIYIEKPEGGFRDIGVACIRDRVVQTSCLILLEPYFEPNFSNYSYAYRPRRNARQALSVLRSRINTAYDWAVIADIKKCFDSIDHNVLVDFISEKISDLDLIDLIKHWLYVDILEFNEFIPSIVGVPQGESLSPLLSNIYLDPLDKHLEKLGYNFVRYADDIIIQTKTEQEAEKALMILQNFLVEPLHLEIKPSKTNYTNIENGIEFLGFRIDKNTIGIRNKKIKSIYELLENYIKKLGDKHSTIEDITNSLIKINATIRGFRNYFALPDEPVIKEQLEFLDGQIEDLAKSILPLKIKDDPAWICRERFNVPKTISDIENYEEEISRKVKSENGYPIENTTNNDPRGLIKDNFSEEKSIIIEDPDTIDSESEKNIRDSIFEIDKRLYVLTHGSYLNAEDDYLVVRKRKKEIARYKQNQLDLVYLQGKGMNISVNLQMKLAELDIPVVFAPTVGTPLAAVNTIHSSKSNLRKLQVLRRDDPDIILTGLNMLNTKVNNQASLLKYFFKYRKRKGTSLFPNIRKDIESIEEIAIKILGLDTGDSNVRILAMGYEGHAASIYWQTIKKLLPDEFDFVGRITKAAKDIVNQCFNYVYGLLYGEVWRSVIKAGLDPYFGFIHGSQRDSGSLIFDIIEEFRSPFADRIVVSLFGRGFRPEINNLGLIKTKSKKILVKSFSKRWHSKIKWHSSDLSAARILEHQAKSLSKLLNHEGKYFPYRMKW